MYSSGASLLVACGVAAVSAGHWRWPLFAWGVGNGVASAVIYQLLLTLMPTLLHAPAEQRAQAQPKIDKMRRALTPTLVSMGIGFGILASGIANAWPDILLTAGILVFQVIAPAVFLPIIRRRAPTAGSA
jgi:preprotein translocase subunit SecY